MAYHTIVRSSIGNGQEKIMGQREKLRPLAGICHVHEVIFNPAEVCLQSCLALRFLVTLRPPLNEFLLFFQTSDRGLACMRTSRKTDFR